MERQAADVSVRNCGTVWQFFVVTPEGKAWVEENVEIAPGMTMGDLGFNADWRSGQAIADGMEAAGLVVSGDNSAN